MSGLTADRIQDLRSLPVRDLVRYWDELENVGRRDGKLSQVVRMLVCSDLYYLLVRVCGRVDLLPCISRPGFVDNEFMFERCREVEANPNGYLDLWAREHGKSSIITFGLTLQNILQNPEITIGIFSHTRPIAKAFLRTLMREIENNRALHSAFPDILCGTDIRQYQKFSEDDGVIVKRRTNPNEATIEAWGLVDGSPVSKHFQILLYDDVVVKESVSNPEMIAKTMTAMEQSYNLGTTPGIKRMAGTRWHFSDAHRTVIDRRTFKAREYPGRKGGTEEGDSVYWDEATHVEKRAAQGPYTYAAQILLNPKADDAQGFKREWLRYYDRLQPRGMNGYILVDSANSKRKESDHTAIWVILLGVDGNYYAADIVRDRINLTERTQRVIALHRHWKDKGVKWQQVRWERYGMAADIEALKNEQEKQNYRFPVTEVAGVTSKDDRIKRLLPIFEQGKMYLPKSKHVTDWQKMTVDLVHSFIEEEFYPFPVGHHKDMLDALARIAEPDLKLSWPKEEPKQDYVPPRPTSNRHQAWMS